MSVMNSRRLRSDKGLPPTVPPLIIKPAAEARSRFASSSSLPVEDEPVLGADLNCSESGRKPVLKCL
jgi:hypothetical protein